MSVHLVVAVIFVIIVAFFKAYKNWRKYYNTILFFGFQALMYEFLFSKKMLWYYQSPYINAKVLILIWIFITFPCTILLFLSYYPEQKSLVRQGIYMLNWVAVYVFIEFILYITKQIVYLNGWNFLWSCVFDVIMFPILKIHHSKPLVSVFLCSVWVIISMLIFKVPLA